MPERKALSEKTAFSFGCVTCFSMVQFAIMASFVLVAAKHCKAPHPSAKCGTGP